jgi:hypothetical protein
MDINGTIKNATFFNNTDFEPLRSPCIKGNVFGDTKGRFLDGDVITTSKIEQMYMLPDGAVLVKTRFSAYRVEFASTPETVKEDPASVLRLFREFVDLNAKQWAIGAGSHHHPMWALICKALGDDNRTKTNGAEWRFIQPLGQVAS